MKFENKKEGRLTAQSFSEHQKICPETEPVYIKVLRKMTGERKLKTAFELYEIALNLCRQNILEQNPGITESAIQKHFDDALAVSEIQKDLEVEYITAWADKLSVRDLWDKILYTISKYE